MPESGTRRYCYYICTTDEPEIGARFLELIYDAGFLHIMSERGICGGCLIGVELVKKLSKSEVDNIYRGSKRSRSLQNRYYNTPLVHWTHEWLPHTGALT